MRNDMPEIASIIDSLDLNDEQKAIAKKIVGRGGVLRASKPKDGTAAYVWRMVAFSISPIYAHHCIPIGADMHLPEWELDRDVRHDRIRARTKELDVIVKAIVDKVPMLRQHGTRRWAKALGY